MLYVTLIRHGMTEGNKTGKYIGTTDEPLCEEGKALVLQKKCIFSERIRNELGRTENWIVSPMLRCVETAKLLHPGIAFTVDENLRECDFGAFENKNYQDMQGDALYQAWIDSNGQDAFPGGESPEGFKERCCSAFAGQMKTAKDGDHFVYVIHGGTIMSIMDRWGTCSCGEKKSYYDWHVKNAGGYLLKVARSKTDGQIQQLEVIETI